MSPLLLAAPVAAYIAYKYGQTHSKSAKQANASAVAFAVSQINVGYVVQLSSTPVPMQITSIKQDSTGLWHVLAAAAGTSTSIEIDPTQIVKVISASQPTAAAMSTLPVPASAAVPVINPTATSGMGDLVMGTDGNIQYMKKKPNPVSVRGIRKNGGMYASTREL